MILEKMAVSKQALWWFVMASTICSFNSCSGSGDTVRHGTLSYNVADIFVSNPQGLALARAAGSGDLRQLAKLVSLGANVNAEGKFGITPLWWAAWAGNYEGLLALLERGADPNIVRPTGPSTMVLIAEFNEPRFLLAALSRGGNPNFRDSDTGDSPLMRAVLLDRSEQIKILLDAGADMNVQKPISGWTLPMTAIGAGGNYKLVYELLQRGADYRLKTAAGRDLAYVISARAINPNSEQYFWREKVIDFLRGKGMPVSRPSHESPRG